VVSAALRGEFDSAVRALPPPSDPPSGICTVKRGPRGRAPPGPPAALVLFDRDGGVKVVSGIDDKDTVRDFSSVWVLARCGR
jgi:hypothetical protein